MTGRENPRSVPVLVQLQVCGASRLNRPDSLEASNSLSFVHYIDVIQGSPTAGQM